MDVQVDGVPSDGGAVVAVMWDPTTSLFYASTIPRGPKKAEMKRATFEQDQANQQIFAPVWYTIARTLYTTGKSPKVGSDPLHAEDGVYYNYETMPGAPVPFSYHPNTIIVAWGRRYPAEAIGEVLLCNKDYSLANFKSRTPNCQTVASALHISFRLTKIDPIVTTITVEELFESDPNYLTDADIQASNFACDIPPVNHPIARRDTTSSQSEDVSVGGCKLDIKTVAPIGIYSFTSTSTLPPITLPAQTSAPSCAYKEADPDAGITRAYCICDSTVTLPVQTGIPMTYYTDACAYATLPAPAAQITPVVDLPPPTTDLTSCQVCTRVGTNEDSCTHIAGCVVQTAGVTVIAGSSPVHVGTLTGTALYTSVSMALETLCPEVTQTTSKTACATDKVIVNGVLFMDEGKFLQNNGELVVTVESSGYNATSLRDAIIKTAALTAQQAATASNCFNVTYLVSGVVKRETTNRFNWRRTLSLRGDRPMPEENYAVWCNIVGFAGVGYYGKYWAMDDVTEPTAWIYPHWEFAIAAGEEFLCNLIEDAIEVFAVIEPEFIVEDTELADAIEFVCEKTEQEEKE